MARIEQNPCTSTRQVASEVGSSHTTVWKVWHEQQLHPYSRQKVLNLHPGDHPLRVAYSEWYLRSAEEQPLILDSLMYSDEATFSREGIHNPRNNHVWAAVNPHERYIRGYQQKFSVNVWAGIISDHLIGPYIMPPRLNAGSYLVFLKETLPELLEDVPLEVRRRMWLQHDGAPAHFGRVVRNHLDLNYPDRWIGRGGPVPWPPRSPDLNPLDFFFWGTMKDLVYETPVDSEEDLVARIVAAADVIREKPRVFARIRQSLLDRCRACIEAEGGHFEHIFH